MHLCLTAVIAPFGRRQRLYRESRGETDFRGVTRDIARTRVDRESSLGSRSLHIRRINVEMYRDYPILALYRIAESSARRKRER